MHSSFTLAGHPFRSRLLVGTGRYADFAETKTAIEASGAVDDYCCCLAISAANCIPRDTLKPLPSFTIF